VRALTAVFADGERDRKRSGRPAQSSSRS
jgi:hypothetical protein